MVLASPSSNAGSCGPAGLRLALATALYRSESVSLGRGARIAGTPLADFMLHVSQEGIPVIRGNRKTLREDLKNLDAGGSSRGARRTRPPG